MREEPSLETLWLRNTGTMDKVQKIDRISTDVTYWEYIYLQRVYWEENVKTICSKENIVSELILNHSRPENLIRKILHLGLSCVSVNSPVEPWFSSQSVD
jgi:hypothetical protein